jgi:hypothetical protein
MDRLQNRLAFGDSVLGKLADASHAVKEEVSTFEERHEALRAAASAPCGEGEERAASPPAIAAWDAALRRLIDRLRAESPSTVGEILASKPSTESPKATTATKRKPTTKPSPKAPLSRASREKPAQKSSSSTEAKRSPKRAPKTKAVVAPKGAATSSTIKRRRGT